MRTKFYFVAALAATMLASCADDKFVGDNSPNVVQNESTESAINFGGGFKAVTRANTVGAAAADLLGKEFIVLGVKGDGTPANMTSVFGNYSVDWVQNTAGTKESNTSDWDYVGKSNHYGLTGAQSIKYWDMSAAYYDFAAFSVGKETTLATSGDATAGTVVATGIDYSNATTSAYSLKGAKADLAKCYITNMKTVAKANYKTEVEMEFRSLASKVRIALYETIPGYSVKDVFFYTSDGAVKASGSGEGKLNNADATLFGGAKAFYLIGTYTVKFPKIGSANASDPDHNQAHVTIDVDNATGQSTQAFGTLQYTTTLEDHEPAGSYLKKTSTDPSFAGTSPYYVIVLPNETGGVLELQVNYTLVSIDGSSENITVHGAKAYVPAAFTKWQPNFAYTYIFKISDNSNGWTNPTDANDETLAGLFPITFDAVVIDSEEDKHQTTITTVSTPSITTYQKGHVYSHVYYTGDIYAQVMQAGSLKGDLNGKTYFYSLSAEKTEADVMDALNIRTSGDATTVVGRNGLTLTPATIAANVTAIPGEDGNDITVTAGQAAKLSPSAVGTYAFVYDYTDGTPTATDVITAVELTGTGPTDWNASDNVYYTDAACSNKANIAFAAGTYYQKYSDLNRTYAVKVINVVAAP